MAILACFTPIAATPQTSGKFLAGRQMFVLADDSPRCPFEMEQGEIARPSTDQRLSKREKRDEQTRRDCVELRFDSRAQHIRDRNAESAAKHQIGNDAERGQKDSQSEKKN